MTKTHLVLPDVQMKPGVDVGFLRKIGKYIVEKKPDVIVCLGDFADMPSLSSYDVGKKVFEGRRYKLDIEAAHLGMDALLEPLREFNEKARKSHKQKYLPDMHMLLGNHEDRILRAINSDPKFDGTISIEDLKYAESGWTVHPFLLPVVLDGICYSHYFTTGLLGRPCTTASAQLSKKHMSCIAGHQQGLQIATAHRGDGKRLTSIIAGSSYEHHESFLGLQGNNHWRGFLMLHEVDDGAFDLMPVSLNYINKKYA
jgi:hypothetical protein